MMEIEIGVLCGQRLNCRTGERKKIASETDAWQERRNNAKAGVDWRHQPCFHHTIASLT